MKWLDWLEKHFGEWEIPEFPLFIVCATSAIYLLSLVRPIFVYELILNPEAVRAGQWWRLITFLFVPPSSLGFFWMILWLYILYQYAQALEQEWGGFRFMVFFAVGALATIVTSMWMSEPLSNLPLYTTLFLAFATLFPDFELLLFFILPIKVKYLGWLIWMGTAYSFLAGTTMTRMEILASLFNYALFFGAQHIQSFRLWLRQLRQNPPWNS